MILSADHLLAKDDAEKEATDSDAFWAHHPVGAFYRGKIHTVVSRDESGNPYEQSREFITVLQVRRLTHHFVEFTFADQHV